MGFMQSRGQAPSLTLQSLVSPGQASRIAELQMCQHVMHFSVAHLQVSEGLDFTDDNARAVICVGVPLPSWKDAKVQLKKQYNNDIARSNPAVLSGEAWYTQQAFRHAPA